MLSKQILTVQKDDSIEIISVGGKPSHEQLKAWKENKTEVTFFVKDDYYKQDSTISGQISILNLFSKDDGVVYFTNHSFGFYIRNILSYSYPQKKIKMKMNMNDVDTNLLPSCSTNKIYIPKELLALIFSYLPINMLGTICRVNSLWNHVASDVDLWEKIATGTDLIIPSIKTKLTKDQVKLMFLSQKAKQTVYIIGKQIRVREEGGIFNLYPPPRKNISKKEFIDAFPQNGSIEIFRTYEDAKEAIRDQHLYTNSDVPGVVSYDFYSPIFKVEAAIGTSKSSCNFSDIKKIFNGEIEIGTAFNKSYDIDKNEVINKDVVKNSNCVIS